MTSTSKLLPEDNLKVENLNNRSTIINVNKHKKWHTSL